MFKKVISEGADRLNWSLEELMKETLEALKVSESNIDHRLKAAFTL